MNKFTKLGLVGLSAGLSVLFSGCQQEKIMVDYVMPARKVVDVSKVNVAAIRVKAKVTGNLAGDSKRNAGLVKQLLAMRLYEEGFYKIADSIWNDPDGASELEKLLKDKDAGHGYAMVMAGGQGNEKVVIDIDLDLALNANPVQKDKDFTLRTVPYKRKKVKDGMPPASEPDLKNAQTENRRVKVTVYAVTAKGTLKARFSAPKGKTCPLKYENSFAIAMPAENRMDTAAPSQLKALAAAVTPAIEEIVKDISPAREPRELVAADGGDDRVVYLLNAKAFPEVVTVVEKLAVTKKANAADYENMGIALEAQGEYFAARDAFKEAVKLNPQSLSAKAGQRRVDDAIAGKKAVKDQGAKQNKDTKFSK